MTVSFTSKIKTHRNANKSSHAGSVTLPIPPPGDLPDSGIKPTSSASPALAGWFFITEYPRSLNLNDAST